MSALPETLTLGVEEEYHLVDAESRALASDPPSGFMERCKREFGDRVVHEFLRSQVEVVTGVCATVADVRAELTELRVGIDAAAQEYGMRLMTASTHPWSEWSDQQSVDLERYRILRSEKQTLVQRMAICGMHIHAGIEDKNLRVDLMGQLSYFIPHLLALSTSSPFWEGHNTGLKAFRPIIAGDLPHSGLPESFESWSDWEEMLGILSETNMIKDPSKIWWDLRPSANHPTLEMRICDVCTRIEDSMAMVALYQSLVAYLIDLRSRNEQRREYRLTLLRENRWRAQRYGVEAEMADFGKRALVSFTDLTDELVELVLPYAQHLGCTTELEHIRTIARQGTSADHQLRVFNEALSEGASKREAQIAVVDWLTDTSIAGCGQAPKAS